MSAPVTLSPARLAFEEGAEEGYTAEDLPALVGLIRALFQRLEGPKEIPRHDRDTDVLPVLS